MYDTAEDEILKIEDVHLHWYFEDSAVTLLMITSEATFKATSKITSEALDIDMNDDISIFSVLDLSNSLLQV